MKRAWILCIVLVTLTAGSPEPAAAASVSWHPTVRLTSDQGLSAAPDIAVDGDIIHVVWSHGSVVDKYNGILYQRSPDGGATWEPAKRLRRWSGSQPTIAVSGDTVHVAWIGPDGIEYRRSDDAGVSWSRTRRLAPRLPGHFDRVDLAVAGDHVHIVWGTTGRGNWAIRYRRSLDGGLTWLKGNWLTDPEGDTWSQMPSLAVRGQSVHVVFWRSPGRYDYRRSVDAGRTWQDAVPLTGGQGSPQIVAIAAARSNVTVAWFQWVEGGSSIWYRYSQNGGDSWSEPQAISSMKRSEPVRMAASGRRLHIVWSDATSGNIEIYYRRSFDGGETWTKQVKLTRSRGKSWVGGIAADGYEVHLVWQQDVRGNAEVFYRRRA